MGKDVWSSQLGFRNHRLLRTQCSSQEGVSDTEEAETPCIGRHPNSPPRMNSPATIDQCGGRWWSVWTHSRGGSWPLDLLLWHAELLITLIHTHTHTHTSTSAASIPCLFLSLCHHPAAAPLKLGGGVLLISLLWWTPNGIKKERSFFGDDENQDNMSSPIPSRSMIVRQHTHKNILRNTWHHFIGVRVLSASCLRSEIHLNVRWHEIQRILALRAPESSLSLPSLASFHPSIPPSLLRSSF